LSVSPDVRFAELDGTVILLELNSAEYFALDDTGSDIWLRLVESRTGIGTALDELRAERGEAITRFVDECLRRNLLARSRPAPVAPPSPRTARRSIGSHRFLTARAWLHLVRTWVLLRIRGFGQVYRRHLRERSLQHPASPDLLQRAVTSFVRAENFFWFRDAPDDCLPRSLALFSFLRSIGLPAAHCIGGTRFPGLLMHAWVESSEHVLLDDPEFVSTLTVLSTIS
jgi:Transglutaminase-like superfamily